MIIKILFYTKALSLHYISFDNPKFYKSLSLVSRKFHFDLSLYYGNDCFPTISLTEF